MLKLFPEHITIPQTVVKATDKAALKDAMFYALSSHHCWIGIRTCYFPDRLGKAPSKMPIKSADDIRGFLEEDYPNWLKTEMVGPGGETLKEIIVLANPPDLGEPALEDQHYG